MDSPAPALPGSAAPASVRLSTAEAMRFASVLEDAVERLSVLQSITPDILAHRDELAQMVGEEISRIIDDQRNLEKRYEQLIAQRSQLKSLSNKTNYKENQAQIEEVARELRLSTKVLTRNLKENPNVAENLLKIQTERSSLQALLSKTMRELKDGNYFKALATVVENDKNDQKNLMDTISREKEASSQVKALQKDLADEKRDREREVLSRNEIITKLKEELHAVKIQTSIDTKYQQMESTAQAKARYRMWKQKEEQFDEQIGRLKRKLEVEVRVNNETESFLKRKQERMQSQIQKWMQKYENDIEEKERELEQLKTLQANDLLKLREFTRRYEEVDTSLSAERQLAAEQQTAKELEAQMTAAAILIQALFRGYRVRKYLSEKKRSKRKSRGGNKGGLGRAGGRVLVSNKTKTR